MKKQIFIICLVILCLFPQIAFASPLINEFSSSATDDWIEIYNPGQESVDLSLYRIRDSTENNKLELYGNLSPLGFAVFDWSNKLNNAGDVIRLVLISDNSQIDQVTYGNQGGIIAPDTNQSAGRITDGVSSWTLFSVHSKNSTNNSSAVFTPPSPTPSKTPTPTKIPPTVKAVTNPPVKTPTPTKTVPTVVLVSKSSAKVSLSKASNSGRIAQAFKEDDNFLSIRNVSETPKSQTKSEVLGARDEKLPTLGIIGGILLILAGISAFVLRYINIEEIYEKIFNK